MGLQDCKAIANNVFAISLFFCRAAAATVGALPAVRPARRAQAPGTAMFIFPRPLSAVLAGLAVALTIVALDHLCHGPAAADPELVPRRETGLSSAPVRDLSLSCRLPPASFASWLPSLKSRIVPDQVAVCVRRAIAKLSAC